MLSQEVIVAGKPTGEPGTPELLGNMYNTLDSLEMALHCLSIVKKVRLKTPVTLFSPEWN